MLDAASDIVPLDVHVARFAVSASHRVGDAMVTRIAEMSLDGFTPAKLFANWDPAIHRPYLRPEEMDAAGTHLLMSVHAWLVRLPGLTALVDAGVGNGKPRPHAPYFDDLESPFLENLAAAGVEPEDIDMVLLTHLHVDHAGWNTRRSGDRWVPTFPNARHVFSRKEHDVFTDPANLDEATRTSFQVQKDSVDPIVAAGLADRIAIDGPTGIGPFVFHPTPGHSPDHASISLTRDDATALFAGDVFHHPVEIVRPELMTIFDRDVAAVRAARDRALAFAADRDALVFTSHAPGTSVGRVRRADAGWSWTSV